MRAVIQRVLKGSVTVDGELISSIGKGLVVLIGVRSEDSLEDIDYIVKKILNVRFFEDEVGKRWAKNVMDKRFEILCVSQFTLCHTLKGNRLDFHHAMKAEESKQFYEKFLKKLRESYEPSLVKDGKFGAYMQLDICNDGPVTVDILSLKEEKLLGKESSVT